MTNKENNKNVDVLLGLQWGDEGKGKIVDVLTPQYDIIARFQGGPNAGHTLEFDGIKHVLHTIPSGIFHKNVINVIGNGVVIDPIILDQELEKLRAVIGTDYKNNLLISKKAHLILPTHKLLDAASEQAKGKDKIGSTLKGIGPAYMDKTGRNGLRIGDIFTPNFQEKYNALVAKHHAMLNHYPNFEFEQLQKLEQQWWKTIETIRQLTVIDSEYFLNKALLEGKKILAEGAQGTLLDVDFGTYPFVTSSNTITAGMCTGLGVPPTKVNKVIGVFKAYCTRVGSGPFPTQLYDETGEKIGEAGHEFGATTGRKRNTGWIDLPALKYACMINGVTELAMMKADVLDQFETIKVCTHYKINGQQIDTLPFDICDTPITPIYSELKAWNCDLTQLRSYQDAPKELKNYVTFLERELKTPIITLSVGPDRKQTLSTK